MKFSFSTSLLTAALLVTSAAAHSWLECVKDEVKNYAAVKADANLNPQVVCHGYPRNKVNNGDWIAESTHYLWDLNSERASNEPGGKRACHPGQRSPVYPANAPRTEAKAGETLRLRFHGNGHASWHWGAPNHMDPGLVRVYYAGGKDKEIVMASELNSGKMMMESNFSADAVTRPKNGNQPDDKANWMQLYLPKDLPEGRHMFVWTWAPHEDKFLGGWRDAYTTCFDIFINGQVTGGGNPAPPPAPNPAPKTPAPNVDERCAKTCLRGGMASAPCTGANCPPCRFGDNCFDYDPKTGKCPPWANGFDCVKKAPV